MKKLILTLFYYQLITQICFAQWYQQNSSTMQNLQALHFVDVNTGWVAGDSGLILHTSNGGSDWIQQVSGVDFGIKDVFFTDSNIGWAVAYESYIGVILKTTDSGMNWTMLPLDTSNCLSAVYFIDENTGWVVGFSGGNDVILKTTDGGNNWVNQSSPVVNVGFNDVYFIDANIGFIAGGYGHNKMNVHSGSILKTTNGGETWSEQLAGTEIHWNAISFSDSLNGIVVGDYSTFFGCCGEIFRTMDGGINWVEVAQNPGGYLGDITIVDSNYAWAAGGGSYGSSAVFLFSSDKGTNWSLQAVESDNLNNVCFINSTTGWAVGFNGTILHTTNGGIPVELTSFTVNVSGNEVTLNWSTATETNNKGFSIERKSNNSEFSDIGFVPGFGTTTEPKSYSYTDSKVSTGKYTYRLKQLDFDGSYEYSQEIEVEVSAPFEFLLEQNYPNPFNPNTVISYQLQISGEVTLSVYDILGNNVATLVNEYKPAGRYESEFNASTLPSGVYF